MAKKIDLFGKSFNTPRTMLDMSSSQPEPFGGIPSGVFAVFAVIILGISIVAYPLSEETSEENTHQSNKQTKTCWMGQENHCCRLSNVSEKFIRRPRRS